MARATSIVQPDYTVGICDSEGRDILVAAIFIDTSDAVDIGLGWDGETNLDSLRAMLQALEMALAGTIAWSLRDNLVDENKRRASSGDEIPF